jgi:uncharacterized protein YodC (DUF2158 family)
MKTYSINDFKAGDVVYLKSDLSQAMTVSKVDVEDNSVKCYWRDKKKNQTLNESFPPEVLCQADERDDLMTPRIYTL